MNNKMAINSYVSASETKKEMKQTRTGTESWTKRELQKSHGDVKSSVGSVVAKELILVTHGPSNDGGIS